MPRPRRRQLARPSTWQRRLLGLWTAKKRNFESEKKLKRAETMQCSPLFVLLWTVVLTKVSVVSGFGSIQVEAESCRPEAISPEP